MEKIKLPIITFVLLFAFCTAMAQRVVEKTLPYQQGQQVIFDLPFGETIQITGWDKNEVALLARVTINSNRLNDAYLLEMNENKNALSFKASFDEEKLKEGKAVDCPDNNHSHMSIDGDQVIICSDIYYELKVPRQAAINLKSISANVEARGLEGPSQIKTISGFIDFSWPQKKDAELQLKSVTGELYTDLDFNILNKKANPPLVGYTLKGRNGSNGPLLDLETISNNIYLRNQ